MDERTLIVRAAALYLPLVATAAAWMLHPPDQRRRTGSLLASLWNLPALLLLHLIAQHVGWWTFHARGGLFAGMPLDFYLGWILLWGALPAVAFPRAPLVLVVLAALAFDLVAMPALAPVLELGPRWLIGEALALASSLVPAQLLARWTADDRRLGARASLQVVCFAGLILCVLPAIVMDRTGGSWRALFDRPGWQTGLLLQVVMLAGLPGLSAVQEFVTRGGGTPIPTDPPRRLVTSGLYAYVANPMQVSGALVLTVWASILEQPWLAAGGVVALAYGAGLARWDERSDLINRFGARWRAYRAGVRTWVPRLRPWRAPEAATPRLYIAAGCPQCSEVRQWLERRRPAGLSIVAAELHPSRDLMRITYDAGDGSPEEDGLAAVARGLEHIHLAYALVGAACRLPIVRPILQLLIDASGAGPRLIVGRATTTLRRKA